MGSYMYIYSNKIQSALFCLEKKKVPSKGRSKTCAPPVDLMNVLWSEPDHLASPYA